MGVLADAYGYTSHGNGNTFLFSLALGSVIFVVSAVAVVIFVLCPHHPMHFVKFEGVLRGLFALEVFRGGVPGSAKVNGFGDSGLPWVVTLT